MTRHKIVFKTHCQL